MKYFTYSILKCDSLSILLIFALSFIKFSTAYPQGGKLDLSFNSTDMGVGYGDSPEGDIYGISVSNNGKILISGTKTWDSEKISLLNSDGSLDKTFNAAIDFPVSGIYCSAIQPDGKVIIGGSLVYAVNNSGYMNGRTSLARLNPDGSMDGTFDPVSFGGFTYRSNEALFILAHSSPVNNILIRKDGRILVFTTSGLTSLNQNGAIDGSFLPPRFFKDENEGTIKTALLQDDGKIIICGNFNKVRGVSAPGIIRLNEDGTTDNTFNPPSSLAGPVLSISLQTNGKIIYGAIGKLGRLNPDGSEDISFSTGSAVEDAVVSHVLAKPNGKIIVAVDHVKQGVNERWGLAQFESDGSLDLGFDIGKNMINRVLKLSNNVNGDVLVGSSLEKNSLFNSVSWISDVGTINNPGSGCTGKINKILLQPDGNIIIGGNFLRYNGESRNGIARILTDGSTDKTFDPGGGALIVDGEKETRGEIYSMALQQDGKILIAGRFNSYNHVPRMGIARLNGDGSLDVSFNPSNWALNAFCSLVSVQSDGKILLAFNYANTNANLIRLLSDGTLDDTFKINEFSTGGGYGFRAVITAIASQSDEKIIVGGPFLRINQEFLGYHFVRLLSDGKIDGSFNPDKQYDFSVNTILIQPDQKILIGGTKLKRFMSNGDLDNSFRSDISYVRALAIQADSKILFSSDVNQSTFGRLYPSGLSDKSFDAGYGTSDTLQTIAVQTDGKILLGGTFTMYNKIGRNRITRVETGLPSSIVTFQGVVDKTLTDPPFDVIAVSSTGLPVALGTSSQNIALNGSTVTILTGGRAVINGTVAANESFAATESSTSFCVAPSQPIIEPYNRKDELLLRVSHPQLQSSPSGFQWFLNAVPYYITFLNGPELLITEPGTYSVTFSIDGCKSQPSLPYQIDDIHKIITAVDSPYLQSGMLIYPNPVHDWLSLHLDSYESSKSLHIEIYDLQGRLMLQVEMAEQDTKIDTSKFPAGIYFVHIMGSKKVVTAKFFKK